MSEINKTEAVVLQKIKYGDTSIIITLFTKDFGKMSAIVKGGRSPKSKLNSNIDILNHLQIVFYRKESREVQLISSASIISHYPNLKGDIESLKFAQAVVELIKNLTAEHDVNQRLFNGIVRILSLMDELKEPASILFARFYMFFLSELGYQLQIEKCSKCGSKDIFNIQLAYNFDLGIFCNQCKGTVSESFTISSELFELLICLKENRTVPKNLYAEVDKAINFMERHLRHHVQDFKGIQSLKIFNSLVSK